MCVNISSLNLSELVFEILLTLVLLFSALLAILKLIDQQTLLLIVLFIIGALTIKYLTGFYLNYVLRIHQSFGDSRSANFLTFDILKFILVLIALISISVLGLNKVLNNETIATLLGGLVGSLLTMRGSYTDLKPLTKEEQKDLAESLSHAQTVKPL